MNEHHQDDNWTYYSSFHPIIFSGHIFAASAFPTWSTTVQPNVRVNDGAFEVAPFGYSVIALDDMLMIQLRKFVANSFYNCGGIHSFMIGYE